MRVLVGHLPHRAHTLDVKREWWQQAMHLCHAISCGSQWILLLDANCRVGSREAWVIGGYQPELFLSLFIP